MTKTFFIIYRCGAFGGDISHKFIQQLCAAQLVGSPLYYSSFANTQCEETLKEIFKEILLAKATIKDIVNIMFSYKWGKKDFNSFLMDNLASLKKSRT